MSGKVESSSKWTLSQLLNRNRANPAWRDLAEVMKTSSEEFGLIGKRSENYETAITQVMNHFDALKTLQKDGAIRSKIGDIMIHNVQSRMWMRRKLEQKKPSKQNKIKKKKKLPGGNVLNKRERDESNSKSPVKVKYGLRKSTNSPSSSGSKRNSPGKGYKLSDAETLLVLHQPLATWKRLMALMRMTSENLGISGLRDEESSVAIAGIMANFPELRPHMDDVSLQKKIRHQMITNLHQRHYNERKRESSECLSKVTKTEKKQRGKKGILKIKTVTLCDKGKKDKPKLAKKKQPLISIQKTAVSTTKKAETTQVISELSVKARQLLFYHHPPLTYQRLRKMMRQTGDQLGLTGLRSSEGLAEIVKIMEAFPQLQHYAENVHVVKKLQSQMILNFYHRKRNKEKSQEKEENIESTSEDNSGKTEDDLDVNNSEEGAENTNNSTRTVTTTKSSQKELETAVKDDTAVMENKEGGSLPPEMVNSCKVEKEEAFEEAYKTEKCETDKEQEKNVLEKEKILEGTKEEKSLREEEAENMDVDEEDDQFTSDKEKVSAVEKKTKETSSENGKCFPDIDNEEDSTAKHTEKDAEKTGNTDKSDTDQEEMIEPQSGGEDAPPATEKADKLMINKKTNLVAAASQPPLETNSSWLGLGKLAMEISEEARQLLVHHHPYETWKQFRDLMRTSSDELGVKGLGEPAALEKVKQIMTQIPQLEPFSNMVPLQQRLQKQMMNNLNQRMWDHNRRNLDTYQPKENALSSVTKWRQTRLFPVKRKNLRDITDNNKLTKQRQVNVSKDSLGSGKCWCQKGRAASWTYNDILHRASGNLPWRHLMNVMMVTSSALNVTKKSSENYQTAVLEVMNHFPGLRRFTDDVSIQAEIGKRMVKNNHQRLKRISSVTKVSLAIAKSKRGRPPKVKMQEKFLKRIAEEKKKQAVKSDDTKTVSENSQEDDENPLKMMGFSTGKCWCQRGPAAKWTYENILVRKIGNKAWKHFAKIMQITARGYNVTSTTSPKYKTAVTEVINHFPALRPFADDASLRKEIGKKMIKNYYRLSKRHSAKSQDKEVENSTTEKEQQDGETDDQKPVSECCEKWGRFRPKALEFNGKKCWCHKNAVNWTYNDILIKTTGNFAWRHFTNVMQFTARIYNIRKLTSTNYEKAVTEVMKHFPALRPLIDDKSVRHEIGTKMIRNFIRLSKRRSGKFPVKEVGNATTKKPGSSEKFIAKNCWCQKKAAATWTYSNILVRTPGNTAWRHFTNVMQSTARGHNVTKLSSKNYDIAVTEVMNHFPALRPLVEDLTVRQEIGKKMIKNYIRVSKRHRIRTTFKRLKTSTTKKEQQDGESENQNRKNAKVLDERESNEGTSSPVVKKQTVKKCWCQKGGASSTWSCNDLLVRSPGNRAWKHFVKVLMDTTNAFNVTKKTSENYQTAIIEVMNHFPALRLMINDDSVQQKIGERMIHNSRERNRLQALREKTEGEVDEDLENTSENTNMDDNGQKPDSIKEESEIFEVEAVLKYAKDLEGGEWYYVKWAGYASDQNTWEPKEHLSGCSKLLKKFHYQLKRAKLTHSGRKRKLSDDGLVVRSKKPKSAKPMSPVSTEALRAMVQEELKNWAISLNYICSDTAPIVVENDVDFEGPPTEFNYINDYISGAGVKIPNDPLVGCRCESCSEEELACCPQNSGVKFAYNRLKHIRVKPGTPIYECNKYCKCGEDCPNRVVQLGRKYPMAIFRTSNGRGWGVKTLVDIRRNTFVMEYVGEVITNEEAERRGKEYDANGRTYLFDLDYNDDDCPFTVDAGKSGNISHFVNHSCDPNLVVYGVWVNCVDPRLPRIALFANRDIKAGEELTFDYQMTGEVGDLSADVKVQHVTCRCGASNCRGFLV